MNFNHMINRVIQGDCLEVMKDIPDNSIDLVVTSPPYDNLRDYEGYDFNFEGIANELFRIIKEGGGVVWVVGDATIKGSETGTSFKQALYFKEIGFNLHDTMIWRKSNFSMPSINRYHQIFEYMFIFTKGSPKTFNGIYDIKNKYGKPFGKNTVRQKDGSMKELPKNEGREVGMRTNVWNMNTVGQDFMCQNLPHPAMFPEKLAQDHILSWSNEGDIILDPMCGSGTTCKMAKLNGRNYIGIDISENYCQIARERINKVPKRLDKFLEGDKE